jgi:SAM-dependent methyltransferase
MNGGYITDVEYTGDFRHCLAPSWLVYIAAINGYKTPRLDQPFTWCELGCGKGMTTLLLAATHPGGEFHACDLNPAHIDYGERLRAASSVENARFHARSIAQMLDTELPQFDFIVSHGVYSWVSAEVRAEICEFARRRLRPGGLFMVSYNAMPGWAHLQPLRQMMQAYAETLPGSSIDKAREAFRYVKFLSDNGALYFKTVPAATEHLAQLARQDIRYVAHEYMTPHGDPFYFAEVEREMRMAGLAFAGSMLPRLNYGELMLPQQFRQLLAGAASRVALETHRDFITNTMFRQDLYAAQAGRKPAASPSLESLSAVRYCLTNLPQRLPLAVKEGVSQYDLDGRRNAVRAIHELLAKGPAGAETIHAAAGLGARDDTASLIQQLVVVNHLAPCPPADIPAGWMTVNSAVIEAGLRDKLQQVPLACPRTGSASVSEVVHAAVIEVAASIDNVGAAAASVLARLRAHAHPVNRESVSGGKRVATDGEVLEYVSATWRRLRDPSTTDGQLLRLFGLVS